jgi:hypothetical protein
LLNPKQGKKRVKEEIALLNINGKQIRVQNQQIIANSFNDYSTTAKK